MLKDETESNELYYLICEITFTEEKRLKSFALTF